MRYRRNQRKIADVNLTLLITLSGIELNSHQKAEDTRLGAKKNMIQTGYLQETHITFNFQKTGLKLNNGKR